MLFIQGRQNRCQWDQRDGFFLYNLVGRTDANAKPFTIDGDCSILSARLVINGRSADKCYSTPSRWLSCLPEDVQVLPPYSALPWLNLQDSSLLASAERRSSRNTVALVVVNLSIARLRLLG